MKYKTQTLIPFPLWLLNQIVIHFRITKILTPSLIANNLLYETHTHNQNSVVAVTRIVYHNDSDSVIYPTS